MGRMIMPVREQRQRRRNASGARSGRGAMNARAIPPAAAFRAALVAIAVAIATPAAAHDLEKTQVSIAFARDGAFVIDVANDPAWLTLRQQSIPGPFADRVVIWVDGHEIRPSSVEFRPGPPAVNRMHGRVPIDARTLRWFYGLVIDPYPLTVRRADGRLVVEEVAGDAWSRTIDLSGQFRPPLLSERVVGMLLAAMLLTPLAIRFATKQAKSRNTRLSFFVAFVFSWLWW
ncbi:MAG: hypothetical protein ACRD2I_18200 [Vicinamibacterales bacterium]